nr:retrovirus-related Pol polyprotein from transposon TNT 1-94 [Tanacetum cinerariifolium]
MENGIRAAVEAIGSFDLILPSGLLIVLDNCHFSPTITRVVVSISRLVNNGYIHTFTNYGISVLKDNVFYFNAISHDGQTIPPPVTNLLAVVEDRVLCHIISFRWQLDLGLGSIRKLILSLGLTLCLLRFLLVLLDLTFIERLPHAMHVIILNELIIVFVERIQNKTHTKFIGHCIA